MVDEKIDESKSGSISCEKKEDLRNDPKFKEIVEKMMRERVGKGKGDEQNQEVGHNVENEKDGGDKTSDVGR